ncbi:hypothetical protein EJ08DRAFT_738932 [Tothia fuscella]|uniref:Zn(2)-C6 fungal-type domain-containing protein n=1 Tax=Tothia fuscella TaxID=1048955 RepID=A0A9P4NFH6_9PEZI|nr:hypothetical protein EJ08DRAFT_738932 [Tothia fuscella]
MSSSSRICPAPRVTWACEACRSRKSRCLPSAEGGICERCLATRSKCVFPSRNPNSKKTLAPQPRRQSTKDSAHSGHDPKPTDPTDNVLSSLFPTPGQELKKDETSALQGFHRQLLERFLPNMLWNTPDEGGTHYLNNQKPPKTTFHHAKLPLKPSISANQAQIYLTRFDGAVGKYFPFVTLPSGWALESILTKRPFLALGIFSAMSQDEPLVHYTLDAEFRKVLSEKVTMNGERSLDIIQGLLVHIAFYPQQLRPRNGQWWQFIQMAISLINDLEYNIPPKQESFSVSEEEELRKIERPEGIRAYMGCYYLSSSLALPPRRANKLDFNHYAEACLSQIAANPVYEADRLLVPMVTIQLIVDEAINANPNDALHCLEGTRPALEVCIDACRNRHLDLADMSNANASQTHPSLRLLQLYTDMKLYAIALTPEIHPQDPMRPSDARLTVLTLCLQAVKTVLEAYISLPLSEYRNFSLPEWSRLIHTIIVLFRLCEITQSMPEWISGANDQRTQFGVYLESLSFRMAELSRSDNPEAPPTVFCLFNSVLPVVRQTYDKMIEKLSQGTSSSDSVHTASTRHTMASRCPLFTPQITHTDYWELLGNSANLYAETQVTSSGSDGFDLLSQIEDWDTWEKGLSMDNAFAGVTSDLFQNTEYSQLG